jgi:crotonobetainyl-CoA:carnitine CoA-transferase CaiB-like acyl-CoA transferase
VEASRPRALTQLGISPEQISHRPGRVWLSLTGYGRDEPLRVAFGDDAAVAGGLVGWSPTAGTPEPVFCADAVGDPLTGLCAALAVTAAVRAGGGLLIDLAMRATTAVFAAAPGAGHGPHPVTRDGRDWLVHCPHLDRSQRVRPPHLPEGAPC